MSRKGTKYLAPLPIVQWRGKHRKTERQYGAVVAFIRSRAGIIHASHFAHLCGRLQASARLRAMLRSGELERVGRGQYKRIEFQPAQDSPVVA